MINLNWPKTETNGMVAWYVIGYRLLVSPIVFLGFGIMYVGIFLMNGRRIANEFYRRNK